MWEKSEVYGEIFGELSWILCESYEGDELDCNKISDLFIDAFTKLPTLFGGVLYGTAVLLNKFINIFTVNNSYNTVHRLDLIFMKIFNYYDYTY